jgi:hypothetical protein
MQAYSGDYSQLYNWVLPVPKQDNENFEVSSAVL